MFGFLNAAPFFVGAVMATLFTDPLINAGLGRRWAIILGGIFSLFPAFCKSFDMYPKNRSRVCAYVTNLRHTVREQLVRNNPCFDLLFDRVIGKISWLVEFCWG
jgi:hypothetical protein